MATFNKLHFVVHPVWVKDSSNLTSKSEGTAEEAYTWNEGIFVPIASVEYKGKVFVSGQANNACIFLGLGYVDVQLIELEELQNDATPNFVEKVLTLFYKDSARLIHNIDHSLIVKYLSKTTSLPTKVRIRLLHCERYVVVWWSIGAKKVKTECTQFMEYCLAGNVEGHY
ncbi:hypothetical protein KY284_018199 [Solanum tuberosum]|nr:hypothetical protein KY284_018199 [Solanum tuberosum]